MEDVKAYQEIKNRVNANYIEASKACPDLEEDMLLLLAYKATAKEYPSHMRGRVVEVAKENDPTIAPRLEEELNLTPAEQE